MGATEPKKTPPRGKDKKPRKPRRREPDRVATAIPEERCYFVTHPELIDLDDEDECRGTSTFCYGCREFICEEHARNLSLMGEHDPEDHLIYPEDLE
jgi:hypothetical protein